MQHYGEGLRAEPVLSLPYFLESLAQPLGQNYEMSFFIMSAGSPDHQSI